MHLQRGIVRGRDGGYRRQCRHGAIRPALARDTARAMSQENVEIARRACEAASRRPKPDFDTLNALAHPDHEMFTVQSLVEGGGYKGARGFREWLDSWGEMFGQDWTSSVEQAKAVDDKRVLVTGWIKARVTRRSSPSSSGSGWS